MSCPYCDHCNPPVNPLDELVENLDPDRTYALLGDDGVEKVGKPRELRWYAVQAWEHDKNYGKEPRELVATSRWEE